MKNIKDILEVIEELNGAGLLPQKMTARINKAKLELAVVTEVVAAARWVNQLHVAGMARSGGPEALEVAVRNLDVIQGIKPLPQLKGV